MDTSLAFSTLSLPPALLLGVEALGYTAMTPVQAQSLPPILEGRDVIAQAPTGSGKTAAFGLGLLQRLDPTAVRTQALVLCPTRELAEQVGGQLRRLALGVPNVKVSVLCGGIPLAPQLASLAHAPHVVVGTPGRIQELLRGDALQLGGVLGFVLDEADRMLDMGFEDQIRDIARRIPAGSQRLLFSATFPEAIRTLAKATLRNPAEVSIRGAADAPAINQVVVEADPERKAPLLAALLLEHRPESCVVFCNMRRDVDEVAASLAHYGFDALALHGDMEQRDRAETLMRFANRSCNVLVASDVAARGLDIEDLAAVVNYDVPSDPDTYLHRIGRTGRAGRGGIAITICTPREVPRMNAIEDHQFRTLPRDRAQPVTGKPKGVPRAAMATLRIDAGKTDKLRPGDIVGALTGDAGLAVAAIGKIDVLATRSYVAIARAQAANALARLREGKIKGRKFRVSAL
ncbi:ATP-dependent RNA helicase DbpA [Luteimonas sp. MC1572]|uniref:ATP-dependent RNA helicase DbpA n=1 Tax=Luteimonas sp. MC1572 TaxID=2799325 RepID=UPI0018F0F910|nr:ATP-dependent RNA helicase DbpA [Luteimonas sp. MC1572]MBJ6982647.1 ATP-dependent RNA helicase DbpA [Luteimonas sp. MC1572]QQO03891.1 ATP-dependent RNA helicase DbpA [Luteimonas sp. MC1572]